MSEKMNEEQKQKIVEMTGKLEAMERKVAAAIETRGISTQQYAEAPQGFNVAEIHRDLSWDDIKRLEPKR